MRPWEKLVTAEARQRTVNGRLEMRAHGVWPFRMLELRGAGGTVATLGPRSWISIYIAGGQKVRLADGAGGRIVGTGMHNWIIPVLLDDNRSTVARATPGEHGVYLIDTVDDSHRLTPSTPRTWRSASHTWELRSWDEPVADLTLHPETVTTRRAIPLATVLLAFTVMTLGIPGEHAIAAPGMQW